MEDLGWRFSWCQLGMNRKNKFTKEGIEAFQERRAGGFNYIFYKDDRLDAVFEQAFDRYMPGEAIELRVPSSDRRAVNRA
jgi:hypothetical protein